ncbi:hypothetical protein B0H67DRAFT_679956 [Lasiosphaeris hirsuta]|uniref:Uncharacterized protein n=1 Tax=Lasiosphaeris hirsuta TaxID=260670 RepID=A0AA40AYJ1_9PEZI|nr:hypothetical protein B0H67DRAFT_679956 [Lasiosphaeris hirsuta]
MPISTDALPKHPRPDHMDFLESFLQEQQCDDVRDARKHFQILIKHKVRLGISLDAADIDQNVQISRAEHKATLGQLSAKDENEFYREFISKQIKLLEVFEAKSGGCGTLVVPDCAMGASATIDQPALDGHRAPTVREIALGASLVPWAAAQRGRASRSSRHIGVEDEYLWEELPLELRNLVPKPGIKTLPLMDIWHETLEKDRELFNALREEFKALQDNAMRWLRDTICPTCEMRRRRALIPSESHTSSAAGSSEGPVKRHNPGSDGGPFGTRNPRRLSRIPILRHLNKLSK